MGEGAWLVAFLVVQRLAELALAQWHQPLNPFRNGLLGASGAAAIIML
jgi:hypothetical protein